MRASLYAGVGRLWCQRITVPHGGIQMLVGPGRYRGLIEVEGWRYAVPIDHLEEDILDGQLADSPLTARTVRETTVLFRVGVQAALVASR